MSARRRLSAIAAVLGALMLLVCAQAGAQEDDDGLAVTVVSTAEYPEVTVEFSVPPGFAGELTTDDVALLEDGSERPSTVTRRATANAQIVLMMDVSGSMVNDLDQEKQAARTVLDAIPSDTEVAVVAFGDGATVIAGLGPISAARSAVDDIVIDPVASTALYGGTILAAQQFDPGHTGPKYILMVTDGGDRVNEETLGEAQAAIRAAGVPVFAISLLTKESDPEALLALAESASGGAVVEADDATGLVGIAGSIASAINERYALTYTSEAHGSTVVEVVASSSDGGTASGSLRLSLPLAVSTVPSAVPGPTSSDLTPLPTLPDPEPATIVVPSPGDGWMRVTGVLAVGTAIAVFAGYFLSPRARRKRRNPIREIVPTASRVAEEGKGATRYLTDAMVRAAERFTGRDGDSVLALMLDRAGVRMRPAEFVVVVALTSATAGLLGWLISAAMAAFLAVLAAISGTMWLRVKGRRRTNKFTEQLPSTLQTMAGGLRAGFSISQVVDMVGRETEPPVRDEFARMTAEEHLGRDITDSFLDAADRMDSDDFKWVAEAIDINRSVGGDLADVLDNVGDTVRVRQSIQREIKTMSAEGRISAQILVAVPVVIILLQFATSPDLAEEFFSPAGLGLLATGAVLMTVGGLMMKRIVSLKY